MQQGQMPEYKQGMRGHGWTIRPAAGLSIMASALVLFVGAGAPEVRTPSGKPPVAALPSPPANGEMGFVLTQFHPAIHEGKDDCPDGLANTVKENFLQTLDPPERTRLLLKINEVELTRRWKATVFGPNNTNLCSNPELFHQPAQKLFMGKVAEGLNLDGDNGGSAAPSGGCAHANFTSPDGTPGIDNQLYRAMGCTRNYRGVDGIGGDVVKGFDNQLATGEHTMVLLLRGVDSLTRDDDVEVILASTDDRPVLDSQRNFITGASFAISDRNPHWRNVFHGRIANGILTTDAVDVRLKRPWGQGGLRGARSEWDIRRGRLQLSFQPDGSLKGLFGGYQPVRNVIESTILGGYGAAETAGIDCAAELAALQKMADGIRDPKTGQCTAVSTAMAVAAVPAFVTDLPPASLVASAEGK